jgi:ribosome-associated protein
MTQDEADDPGADGGRDHLSKSARKREASSLQDLGVELAALADKDIDSLALPDKLAAALKDLKRLPTNGAKLRQRQFIGKLMRGIDPEPVLATLAARKRVHDMEIRQFQKVERWRDRLLSEPAARLELLEEYPSAEAAELDGLLAKAARERADSKPPAAARELFAFLRRLMA